MSKFQVNFYNGDQKIIQATNIKEAGKLADEKFSKYCEKKYGRTWESVIALQGDEE